MRYLLPLLLLLAACGSSDPGADWTCHATSEAACECDYTPGHGNHETCVQPCCILNARCFCAVTIPATPESCEYFAGRWDGIVVDSCPTEP